MLFTWRCSLGLLDSNHARSTRLSLRDRSQWETKTSHLASRHQTREWWDRLPLHSGSLLALTDSFPRSIVFLDKDNNLKLGDFGLSKAMQQAAMTQTYVGVRLYHVFSYAFSRSWCRIAEIHRLLTTCHPNWSMDNLTTSNLIFGHSDVWFTNFALDSEFSCSPLPSYFMDIIDPSCLC